MLKLEGISIITAAPDKLPGARTGSPGSAINFDNANIRGWRVVIKGAMVVFVSPKGWEPGKLPREWDRETGAVVSWEVPRSSCCLKWSGSEDNPEAVTAALQKGFVSDPIGKPFAPEELEMPKPKAIPTAELGDE